MINAREVAFIKTTGEAVFVLGIQDPAPKLGDKDLVVEVRRPVGGQNGLFHVTETFFLAELESIDDQRKRFMADNAKLVEKYGPKVEDVPATDSDIRFGSN